MELSFPAFSQRLISVEQLPAARVVEVMVVGANYYEFARY